MFCVLSVCVVREPQSYRMNEKEFFVCNNFCDRVRALVCVCVFTQWLLMVLLVLLVLCVLQWLSWKKKKKTGGECASEMPPDYNERNRRNSERNNLCLARSRTITIKFPVKYWKKEANCTQTATANIAHPAASNTDIYNIYRERKTDRQAVPLVAVFYFFRELKAHAHTNRICLLKRCQTIYV